MFSQRSDMGWTTNLLANARRTHGVPDESIHDLTETNPTRTSLAVSAEELQAWFTSADQVRYDPAPFGLPEARAAVARYHGVRPERVVLSASTSEAYAWLFQLLCDPGDTVLVPTPSYPLFEHLARLQGVVVHEYPSH